MGKHTPGPWFVGPLDGKYYGTWVAIGAHQGITVWTPDHYADPFASAREIEAGWMPEDGHDHVEDVQSYANALLIAAAPEMLALLTDLRDCGEWYRSALEIDTYADHGHDGHSLKARLDALIAKAEGA